MVFHKSLNDTSALKSPGFFLVFRLISTMVSTRPLISWSSSSCTNPLVTVPSELITIGITFNYYYYYYYYCCYCYSFKLNLVAFLNNPAPPQYFGRFCFGLFNSFLDFQFIHSFFSLFFGAVSSFPTMMDTIDILIFHHFFLSFFLEDANIYPTFGFRLTIDRNSHLRYLTSCFY